LPTAALYDFLSGATCTDSDHAVYGRSLDGIMGLNPAGSMNILVVSVVWCQGEVSVTALSLIHRSPTGCCVSDYDQGTL